MSNPQLYITTLHELSDFVSSALNLTLQRIKLLNNPKREEPHVKILLIDLVNYMINLLSVDDRSRSRLLGLYQEVLERNGVPLQETQEQQLLRLTGLVAQLINVFLNHIADKDQRINLVLPGFLERMTQQFEDLGPARQTAYLPHAPNQFIG